jgi:hypothetical protein
LVLWVEGVTDAAIQGPSVAEDRTEGVVGALIPLIRRALQRELAIPEEDFDRLLSMDRIETAWIGAKLRDARHRPGRFGSGAELSGRARKLMIALTSAKAREPDAMVIAVWDRDARPERLSDRDEILRALRASRYEGLAVGVCVEEVEAWLLADAGCFRKCFGAGPAKLPGSVEALADPKSALDAVLEGYPEAESEHLPSVYRKLAEQIDVDVLERVCPSGFGRFRDALRELIVPVLVRGP